MSAPEPTPTSDVDAGRTLSSRVEEAIVRADRSSKLLFAALLSSAALGSAWCSQQTRIWSGIQSESYAEATALRAASAAANAHANTQLQIEIGLFSQWLNAHANGQDGLAENYRERFRPAFRERFDAWRATEGRAGAPDSPFDLDERRSGAAAALQQRSDAMQERGMRATHWGDRFGQINVVFASGMFIAGIGNQFEGARVRVLMLALSAATCAWGMWRLFQMPLLPTP